MTLLEDLYYGNITPSVRKIKKNSEYDRLVKEYAAFEDKFTSELGKEQKETYEELCDINSDMQGIREFELFREGFRLGLGFSIEAFFIDDKNFEKI